MSQSLQLSSYKKKLSDYFRNVLRGSLIFLIAVIISVSIFIIEPIVHYIYKANKNIAEKENTLTSVEIIYYEPPEEIAEEKIFTSMKTETFKTIQSDNMSKRFELDLTASSSLTGTGAGVSGFGAVNYEEGQVDQNAAVIRRFEPVYPQAALERRIEKNIELRVLVKRDGSVGEVVPITEEDRFRFVNSAINAVYKYRFEPALLNGIAVNQWVKVNIYFRIK